MNPDLNTSDSDKDDEVENAVTSRHWNFCSTRNKPYQNSIILKFYTKIQAVPAYSDSTNVE